jgi:hypothetical protein
MALLENSVEANMKKEKQTKVKQKGLARIICC